MINRPFEMGYRVIGFPFVQNHWAQSRYTDGSFGVWYGSDSIVTSAHKTAHHFYHELVAQCGGTQSM